MSQTLDNAIKELLSTYQPLDYIARALIVDGNELMAAMKKADPESEEFLVMTYLAKYNLIKPSEINIEIPDIKSTEE